MRAVYLNCNQELNREDNGHRHAPYFGSPVEGMVPMIFINIYNLSSTADAKDYPMIKQRMTPCNFLKSSTERAKFQFFVFKTMQSTMREALD